MGNFDILYLDNDSFFAAQVKNRLEWQGYRVTVVENEQAFLLKKCRQSYDLLIIDLLTLKLNAYSFLMQLKQQKMMAVTLLVSSDRHCSRVDKYVCLGYFEYLLKDLLVKRFVEQVNLNIYRIFEKNLSVKKNKFLKEKTKKRITTIATKAIGWEYLLADEKVQWTPLFSPVKISLSYGEFMAKVHQDDVAHVKVQNNICLFSQQAVEYDFRYLFDSSQEITFHIQINAVLGDNDAVVSLCGQLQVLSSRRLSDSSFIKQSFIDHTNDAVFITNEKRIIISVNQAFTQITGYSKQKILQQRTDVLNTEKFGSEFFSIVADNLEYRGFWQGEIAIRHSQGHYIPGWQSSYFLKDTTGNISQTISVFKDITQQKADDESIKFQANYDALTHLPNRTLFTDRLNKTIQLAKRKNSKFALMLLDLNKFKWINDTLGHHAGDILLQKTGKMLEQAVRDSDTVARLGGDEFSIIVPELEKTTDAELIARKIFNAFKNAIVIDHQEVFVSGSIGITIFPDDGEESDMLQKNADSAMYIAKSHGENRYFYYTQAIQKESEQRLKLIDDMRSAMLNQEFILHYQPIINMMTKKVSSAETLLRWKHPQAGYIPLNDFIPLAEESGLIREIGNWVIEEVATHIQRWSTLGLPALHISVNQSVAQYSLSGCHIEWLNILKRKQIPLDCISFEVSEKIFFEEKNSYLDSIKHLKQEGIQISLDGFGTGYSSLSYLKKYPVDTIKIDRSYIHSMVDDPINAILVETIIVLANKLGIKVIATGVENRQQLALLNLQCQYVQGHYFSKPLPLVEFESFIRMQS